MKKILIALLLLAPALAGASEVTGTLTTGIASGVEGVVITAPSASPNEGVYSATQEVTLTAAGSSSIHYTIDGSTPTCTSGSAYGAVISVSASQVIQALSCYPNGVASAVSVFGYAINPPAPPVPPAPGG